MVAPTLYTSADASAPVLTGEVDKLRLLLKACLVDGYGALPAAGWTMPYSATNYGAFRQGGGNQHYLWVNDSNAQMSRVVGYTAMTGILDGTGPFYPEATFAGGLYARKSATANATARPWLMYATNQTFYLFIFGASATFGTFSGGDSHLAFGQLSSRLTGDAMHTFLLAATDTSTTSTSATVTRQSIAALGSAQAGHAIAANYTQSGGGVNFSKRPQNNLFLQTVSGSGGVTYPDAVTGDLLIEPIVAQDLSTHIRGTFPGLWSISHPYTSFAQFDTFSGVDGLAGKEFKIINTGIYAVAIETNGGW